MRVVVVSIACLFAGAALTAGCSGPRGPAGAAGAGCKIVGGDGGSRVITCDDGTTVTVNDGRPGASCTVSAAPDGGPKTIRCEDGTSVTVSDGDAGSSCTTGTSDAGIKVITCSDGTSVTVSPDPLPVSNVIGPADELPGLVLHIVSLAGASGGAAAFQIGDTMTATFTVRTRGGRDLPLSVLDESEIWIAGPTSGYQRVLPAGREQLALGDVAARATRNPDGSWSYKFAAPLPASYGPPLYDTARFSAGELTGQPLQHGTYTVAMRASRIYHVGLDAIADVGAETKDFLLGTATTLQPRDVVGLGNCNSCHVTLQAHGGAYRDTKLCVTCHTVGAEDSGSAATGDPTPVTIAFATLMHKLHDGAHLPSVRGVGVNADGTRSYAAAPAPYRVGGGASARDFSDVQFPVWPSLSFPMPRNKGYTALTAPQQATDDAVRSGVVACEKCHGDPDGSGPLQAPAQGEFAFSHQSREACGSCHDDIDWSKSYVRNTDTGMPAQPNDGTCLVCHPASGFAVGGSPRDGHRHPLYDATFNRGLKVLLTAAREAGASNGNGKLDVGEKVAVTFNVTDDGGAAFTAAELPALSVLVTGPTSNRNLLLSSTIPASALAVAPPWTMNLPEVVVLELVGSSTAATGDAFTAARAPIWTLAGATPTIFVRTGAGAVTTLAAPAPAWQNFVTVASAAGFARNDYVVVEDGVAGVQEYLRVQLVDGNRLWFAGAAQAGYQPGLRRAHAAGAAVTKVTLATKTATTDYTVSGAAGTITEVTEFGAGAAVLASYTTDFVIPAVYGPPLNDSPDLGESAGKWKGLPLVPGTYTVGLWGSRTLALAQNGETTSYRSTSPPATLDFLVGTATTLTPVKIIESAAACANCHTDVYAHGGGRRGVETCLLCHGSAGSEDRPRYVAAAAPATTGVTVEFRDMLHRIHRGRELANAATYAVVGFGAGAYPNNFSVIGYGEVEFPAMPAGVKDCRACHGASEAWRVPADRGYPESMASAKAWGAACGGCHDAAADRAHFEVMTSSVGAESCAVCHGAGHELEVGFVHKLR